ncbi:hypothetical protein JXA31_03865, partial [Candidatus Bathyarchaeota archaeon]|nr:hypothetical protein [Candidatus Bathyarchaeota archaeon]
GNGIIALTLTGEKKKIVELAFAAVFSAVILILFYSIMSMNGLVLGNDPAVHLEKAQIFLQTGKISLDNLSWAPPLYQILLATLIAFTGTGTSNLEQMILLVKTTAVLIDWLLFFSVYLIGAKFFNKKTGAIAAVLLLLCFPIYEINSWGGYTTVLGLSFMFLLFLYLPLATKDFGHIMVTFLAGFSLVLSHQLATFLTVLILPPVVLFMLIKSRGTYLKALIALILGGGIAFFLYYFQPVISHIDIFIEHVFLSQKTMVYQIGATTFNAFMVNFGFVLFFAVGGSLLAFFSLRAKKTFIPYMILILSLIVPFVLAESHLFGLYLPFQWFIYYLMPPLAVFAAVAFDFIIDKLSVFYFKYKTKWKPFRLKAVAVSFIILMFLMFVFRFGVVYGKIMEASVYYSTTDLKAYDAGVWLRNNFPDETTVVVTEVPGFWFRLFSGKTVIAETNPIIERNLVAASVLELAYELEHPLILVRAYDMTKGDVADENYVSINDVWYKVSRSAADGNKISYRANGVYKEISLSTFTRESVFEDQTSPKKLTFRYSNDEVIITQTILVQNDMYPINVAWSLSPTESEITDVALYVSTFFDLQFSFEEAYVPDVLDWQNPWDSSSYSQGDGWAVVDFSRSNLTGNYLGFYDAKEEIVFALHFEELPDWGNVGALSSRQIDAVRFQYDFDEININQTVSFTYQFLTFSKDSFPEMPNLRDLKGLFDFKPAAAFELKSRDYHDYIKEYNIGFLVYDKNQLDTKIIRCKLLEIVYSNDRYAIFKIKSNP